MDSCEFPFFPNNKFNPKWKSVLSNAFPYQYSCIHPPLGASFNIQYQMPFCEIVGFFTMIRPCFNDLFYFLNNVFRCVIWLHEPEDFRIHSFILIPCTVCFHEKCFVLQFEVSVLHPIPKLEHPMEPWKFDVWDIDT